MKFRRGAVDRVALTIFVAITVLIPATVKLATQRQELRSKAACDDVCYAACEAAGGSSQECGMQCCTPDPPPQECPCGGQWPDNCDSCPPPPECNDVTQCGSGALECLNGHCIYPSGNCGGVNCGANQVCIDNVCVSSDPTCQRDCSNKNCGDDGCGGNCGACNSWESCSGGKCVAQQVDCPKSNCYDDCVFCQNKSYTECNERCSPNLCLNKPPDCDGTSITVCFEGNYQKGTDCGLFGQICQNGSCVEYVTPNPPPVQPQPTSQPEQTGGGNAGAGDQNTGGQNAEGTKQPPPSPAPTKAAEEVVKYSQNLGIYGVVDWDGGIYDAQTGIQLTDQQAKIIGEELLICGDPGTKDYNDCKGEIIDRVLNPRITNVVPDEIEPKSSYISDLIKYVVRQSGLGFIPDLINDLITTNQQAKIKTQIAANLPPDTAVAPAQQSGNDCECGFLCWISTTFLGQKNPCAFDNSVNKVIEDPGRLVTGAIIFVEESCILLAKQGSSLPATCYQKNWQNTISSELGLDNWEMLPGTVRVKAEEIARKAYDRCLAAATMNDGYLTSRCETAARKAVTPAVNEELKKLGIKPLSIY